MLAAGMRGGAEWVAPTFAHWHARLHLSSCRARGGRPAPHSIEAGAAGRPAGKRVPGLLAPLHSGLSISQAACDRTPSYLLTFPLSLCPAASPGPAFHGQRSPCQTWACAHHCPPCALTQLLSLCPPALCSAASPGRASSGCSCPRCSACRSSRLPLRPPPPCSSSRVCSTDWGC